MASFQRMLTLTTDFGITDHFVGVMKGVIYNINPQAEIVEICNSVHSYDVLDGALTISQAYNYFPANTVHIVVVDPGVGTTRKPLLVTTDNHIFLAPDNGVLSLVYDKTERLSVRHITADHYFLQPTSQTFQGRDVFAAVAGWLSKGVETSKFGDEITEFVRFAPPRPKLVNDKIIKGVVLKQDKFGNLITNLTPADVPQIFQPEPPPFKILVNNKEILKVKNTYASGAAGEVFGILGSMGYLEISANRGSASKLLAADKGTEVGVVFETSQFTPAAAVAPVPAAVAQ